MIIPINGPILQKCRLFSLSKRLRKCVLRLSQPLPPISQKRAIRPGAAYNASAKFFAVYQLPIDPAPDLRISHIAIDRAHTTAEDSGTYLPLAALKRAQESGIIGSIAPHIYGFPTNRSQRANIDNDAPQLVKMLQADKVDAIIAIPNCPVCHQSVSIAARAAEDAGISSVIMGCALDIVQHAGAPRFYFSDFPLGNSCGRPNDPASQDATLKGALDLLVQADRPRTSWHSPLKWQGRKTGKRITQISKNFPLQKLPKGGQILIARRKMSRPADSKAPKPNTRTKHLDNAPFF